MTLGLPLHHGDMSSCSKKSFSFPKSARLLKSNHFRRVSKQGRVISGKFLFMQVCETRKSSLKLGLTVPRKYGDAVRRNRFKRLVREAFRLSQHLLPSDIHINIRPAGTTAIPPTLQGIQEELLHHLGISIAPASIE